MIVVFSLHNIISTAPIDSMMVGVIDSLVNILAVAISPTHHFILSYKLVHNLLKLANCDEQNLVTLGARFIESGKKIQNIIS